VWRACLLLLWLGVAARSQPSGPPRLEEELASLLKQFAAVYQAAEENAADPPDAAQAIYGGAIPGLLRALDPYSAFLDQDQFRSLQEMQQSVEKGFGSVVSIGLGRVIVLQTLARPRRGRACRPATRLWRSTGSG